MLDTYGDKCHSGKQGKARTMVLLAANMDSNLKLRSLAIEKFQTLTCMLNSHSIPVVHTWNKSWMPYI